MKMYNEVDKFTHMHGNNDVESKFSIHWLSILVKNIKACSVG